MAEYGYAGTILYVNLSGGEIRKLPTADYADKYIGGRGFAVRLYWELVPPEAKAFDPDNCFIAVTGPAAGFPGIAGFRWQVCGMSAAAEREAFSYGNLGGPWGGYLKYAGYDALVVQGKADKPVYLYIDEDKVEIRDGSHIWGKTTYEATDILKAELGEQFRVMVTGQAGENLVKYATVFADEGASGSGGLGSVMGSKMLKAVAVAGSKRPVAADPDRLQKIADRLKPEPTASRAPSMWGIPGITQEQICYGCELGCTKTGYYENGTFYKQFCQSTEAYQHPPIARYGPGEQADKLRMLGTKLADGYSIDTVTLQSLIDWLILCYDEGLINEKETGLPLGEIGTQEFIETLLRQISYREGFGNMLADGILKTSASFGSRAKELTNKVLATPANEKKDYDARLFVTTALLYATEPRRPIHQLHEVSFAVFSWLGGIRNPDNPVKFTGQDMQRLAGRFWGSEIAGDFSTYEGKALAAKLIQDRQFVKESLILCDFKSPNTVDLSSPDHVGDPMLESQVYSAITGIEKTREEMDLMGERIVNVQRAGRMRQGWGGREGDTLMDYLFEEPLTREDLFFNPECLIPGKDGETFSRLEKVVERDEFEKMKDDYYTCRGWDVETGLQTRQKLHELELDDIADDLATRGMLK
ncbi:MAG: hypothetical protein JW712_00790 [Dehalococcoidales bacterium]|nr:hypothetical protein [Dehalococcoidales bacterium]